MTREEGVGRSQDLVREFHLACGLPIGDERAPHMINGKLRIKLLKEELREFCRAVRKGDLVEAADALADMRYLIDGAAVEWGIDLEPVFDEVHRTNMLKTTGPKRRDGKQLKPEGWQPPDIEGVLKRQVLQRYMERRRAAVRRPVGFQ